MSRCVQSGSIAVSPEVARGVETEGRSAAATISAAQKEQARKLEESMKRWESVVFMGAIRIWRGAIVATKKDEGEKRMKG